MILRNEVGQVLVSIGSTSVRAWDAESAEAAAILFELNIAKDCGFRVLVIESDSKLLIDQLYRKFTPKSNLGS